MFQRASTCTRWTMLTFLLGCASAPPPPASEPPTGPVLTPEARQSIEARQASKRLQRDKKDDDEAEDPPPDARAQKRAEEKRRKDAECKKALEEHDAAQAENADVEAARKAAKRENERWIDQYCKRTAEVVIDKGRVVVDDDGEERVHDVELPMPKIVCPLSTPKEVIAGLGLQQKNGHYERVYSVSSNQAPGQVSPGMADEMKFARDHPGCFRP